MTSTKPMSDSFAMRGCLDQAVRAKLEMASAATSPSKIEYGNWMEKTHQAARITSVWPIIAAHRRRISQWALSWWISMELRSGEMSLLCADFFNGWSQEAGVWLKDEP